MARAFDPSGYFTRFQADGRYQRISSLAAPSAFSVSGTGVITTSTSQFAYLDLSFTAPPTLGSANVISQYVVKYSYVSGLQTIASTIEFPASGPFRLQNLAVGVTYTLQIAAIDAYGQTGAFSTAISSTTGFDTVAPAAPTITGLAVTGGADIQVASLNTEADFIFYELRRQENVSTAADVVMARFKGTIFYDHSIPTTDNYWYRVWAYDISGNTSISNQIGPFALQATAVTIPAEPSLNSLTANADGTMTLSWNTVANAVTYRIWHRPSGQTIWILVGSVIAGTSTTQSYVDVSASSGTAYDYTASTVGPQGQESTIGSTFLSATAHDTTPPGIPGLLTFASGLGTVIVSWTASTPVSPVQQVLYGVGYRVNSGAAWTADIEVVTPTFTLYGLSSSRDTLAGNLEFRVRSVDQYGNASAYSDPGAVPYSSLLTYAPVDATVPAAPIFPSQVAKDDGSITLSWPWTNVPDIWGYRVDRRINVGGVQSTVWEILSIFHDPSSGTKQFSDTGLEPYSYRLTTYDYAIYAIDSSGNISSLNLAINSSFETGSTAGWSGTGTVSSLAFRDGLYSALVGSTTTLFQNVPVVAGLAYSLSAYFKQNITATTATIALAFFNVSSAQVGSTITATAATSTSFSQVMSAGNMAPAGAVTATLTLSTSNTNTAYVDDVQFEQSSQVTPYGDGKLLGLQALHNTLAAFSFSATASGVLGGIKLVWSNGTSINFVSSNWIVSRGTVVGGPFTPVLYEVGAADGSVISSVDDFQITSTTASTFFYQFQLMDRWNNVSPYLLTTAISATSLTQDQLDTIAPATPTGLAAGASTIENAQKGQIATQALSWTANTETDLSRYEIEYWPGTTSTPGATILVTSVGAGITSLTIRGLLPNNNYTYRIRAWDTWSNASGWSTAVTALTARDTTAPGTPATPSIAAGLRSLALLLGTLNTEVDLDHYNWYRNTSNTFIGASVIGSGPSLVDNNVTQGTTYFYWITAVDTSGNESAPSAPVNAIPGKILHTDITDGEIQTPALSAGAVTTSKLSVLNRTVITSGMVFTPAISTNTLSWTAGSLVYENTNFGSIAAGSVTYIASPVYVYFDTSISTTALQTSTTLPSSSTCAIVGLYSGGGNWSQNTGMTVIDGSFVQAGTITATQIQAGTITATQIQAGTITSTQISASGITASKIIGGVLQSNSGLAKFDLTNNLITINDGTFNRVTIGNFNSDYGIQVLRKDGSVLFDTSQSSAFPSSLLAQTLTPSVATGWNTSNGVLSAIINLSWTVSAAVNDLDSFEIQWLKSGDSVYQSAYIGSDATSFSIKGLLENTTYSLRVRAANKMGQVTAWATASQGTGTYTVTGVFKFDLASPKNFYSIPDPDSQDNDPTIDADFGDFAEDFRGLSHFQKRTNIHHKGTGTGGLVHVGFANLKTIEPYFDHFYVEVYLGATLVFKANAAAQWDGSTYFSQTGYIVAKLKNGTTYTAKAYVVGPSGRQSLPATSASFVAGVSTAPSNTATGIAATSGSNTVTFTGNLICDAITDHVDFYYNVTGTAPSSSTKPLQQQWPAVADGATTFAFSLAVPASANVTPAQTAYFWYRQVGLNGSLQAWQTGGNQVAGLNSSTPLNGQGSLCTVPHNTFTYTTTAPTSTTAHITWTWTAFPIYRLDGTSFTVPAAGGSAGNTITFSSLNSATTYYFIIYYTINTGLVTVVMSTQGTPTGTSQEILPGTLVASQDHNVPVVVNTAAVTASTGGSGGGGGGGDTCPAIDQQVETLERGYVLAETLSVNEHIRGMNGEWNRIKYLGRRSGKLIHLKIGPETFHVDLGHRWLLAGGIPDGNGKDWIHSYNLTLNTFLQCADGGALPVRSIGEPHSGDYIMICCENSRFRLGSMVGHNLVPTV